MTALENATLFSDSPGQLRRCSLLKISPSVKVIGTHAMRPDSLLLPTLYPNQCKTLVFCSASTLLLCRGKVLHKHTLTRAIGSKSALFFFVCNSRVTQLTLEMSPETVLAGSQPWTCPLAPVSAPTTCAHSRIHVDAFLSKLVCMRTGVWMHILLTRSSHMHANTHAFSSAHIHSLSLVYICAHTQTFLKAPVFRKVLFIGPAWLWMWKGESPSEGSFHV